jgi:Ni/Co efflux regulator RcnB
MIKYFIAAAMACVLAATPALAERTRTTHTTTVRASSGGGHQTTRTIHTTHVNVIRGGAMRSRTVTGGGAMRSRVWSGGNAGSRGMRSRSVTGGGAMRSRSVTGGGAMRSRSVTGGGAMRGRTVTGGATTRQLHGILPTTRHTAVNVRSFQRNFTAPHRYHFGAVYSQPHGWYSHRWVYGESLPGGWYGQDYWISNYAMFGLIDPPGDGYEWVRVGDDALLVDTDSGEVVQVEYGVFY